MEAVLNKKIEPPKPELTLDVGYSKFNIVFDASLEKKESLLGETDFDKHQIRLQKDLDPRVYKEVFWHEVSHVLIELAGYGGHPDEEDTQATLYGVTNEELVTRMSRSIILLFRLNPWLKETL